jgi:hypothetical protein
LVISLVVGGDSASALILSIEVGEQDSPEAVGFGPLGVENLQLQLLG